MLEAILKKYQTDSLEHAFRRAAAIASSVDHLEDLKWMAAQQNFDVNIPANKNGKTALHYAIEFLESALQRKIKNPANTLTKIEIQVKLSVILFLIEAGANAKLTDHTGHDPFYFLNAPTTKTIISTVPIATNGSAWLIKFAMLSEGQQHFYLAWVALNNICKMAIEFNKIHTQFQSALKLIEEKGGFKNLKVLPLLLLEAHHDKGGNLFLSKFSEICFKSGYHGLCCETPFDAKLQEALSSRKMQLAIDVADEQTSEGQIQSQENTIARLEWLFKSDFETQFIDAISEVPYQYFQVMGIVEGEFNFENLTLSLRDKTNYFRTVIHAVEHNGGIIVTLGIKHGKPLCEALSKQGIQFKVIIPYENVSKMGFKLESQYRFIFTEIELLMQNHQALLLNMLDNAALQTFKGTLSEPKIIEIPAKPVLFTDVRSLEAIIETTNTEQRPFFDRDTEKVDPPSFTL